MKYTTKSHFSREEKLAIITEYETSPLSGSEICAKYGIKHCLFLQLVDSFWLIFPKKVYTLSFPKIC